MKFCLLFAVMAFVCYSTVDAGMPNTSQRIICDACIRRVTDCNKYVPSKDIFNPYLPAPSTLGKLLVCDASDLQLWTTDGDFKISEDSETRSGCPCFTSDSCNRRQKLTGKLSVARRNCGVAVSNMPKNSTLLECTKMVKNKYGGGGKNDWECQQSYVFDDVAASVPKTDSDLIKHPIGEEDMEELDEEI